MADSPLWAAIRAVKGGMSGRAGLAAAREKGLHVADSTWYRMIGEVRRSLGSQIDEVTRPMGQRPGQHEIQGFQAKNARGYMQYVDVFVRDRETGLVTVRPYAVRTQELLRRGQVVNRALKFFQASVDLNAGDYDEQVLGAVYTSTFQFVPEA